MTKNDMDTKLRNDKRMAINNELSMKLSRKLKRDAKAAIGLDVTDESDTEATLIMLAKVADPSKTWEELDEMGTGELFAVIYPEDLVPSLDELQAIAEEQA